MNILYVQYGYNEGPAKGGADQRSQYIIEALRSRGEVYILAFTYYPDEERYCDNGRIAVRCIERRMSPLYIFNRFVQKWLGVVRYHPFGAKRAVARAFPGIKFDAVVCRFSKIAGYAKLWDLAPVFVDVDDYPLEMFQTAILPHLGISRGIAGHLVRHWQANIFRRAQGLWVANPKHVAMLPEEKGKWLPNLPPRDKRGPCAIDLPRDSIMTVASFAHSPNAHGVSRFLAEVWPQFHAKHPNIRYRLIGKAIPPEFGSTDGVDVVGFVDDIRPEYERAFFACVPIFSGSGTCIKALEAPSMGRVALCSPFGARGIADSLLGQGVEAANDRNEFLSMALRLVEDQNHRENEERAAPSAIEKEYNFAAFSRTIHNAMECISGK